jgi:hypothetical protein
MVTAPATTRSERYYVVGAPVNGRQEYLFDIAVRTLGNGERYPEIFALNEGRPQPDDGRLEDPAILKPGWILVLPNDVSGPDVHIGLFPVIADTSMATPEPTDAPAYPYGAGGAE